MILTYLGPAGTFAHRAAQDLRPESAELVPAASVPAAFEAVRSGRVDGAVVPVENSVEGSVAVTLDELTSGSPLRIAAEATVPVTFNLVVPPGGTLAEVTAVGTHPHAEAQCRHWLAAHLPEVPVIPTPSTAGAAAAWQQGSGTEYNAAIVPPGAATSYPVETLASNIEDTEAARTRFLLVAPAAPPPPPSGHDKTSLVLYIKQNRSGALLQILTEFAMRDINLTRIESRPTRQGLGDYCFSVDLRGHIAEPHVGDALNSLVRQCADVRFLGSYPAAETVADPSETETIASEYAHADKWLAAIRATGTPPVS